MNNYAYIDNQNLYLATMNAPEPWTVDMKRFRVYLLEKYKVERAYLFMGAYDEKHDKRYRFYAESGYKLMFRPHLPGVVSAKKGNVDTDVVYQLLVDAFCDMKLDKVVLVSGDGDYFKTVKRLSEMDKLEKILLPSHKNASSLYKVMSDEFRVYLDNPSLIKKLKIQK